LLSKIIQKKGRLINKKRAFSICLFLSIAVICASCSPTQEKIERYTEDGVEVVINHLEPYKIEGESISFEINKDYRIDLEPEEIAELGISDVESLEVDSDGNIYFLVRKASENSIYKFDSYGKYANSFGKRGQGPGEITNPTFFCIDKNDEVIVTDFAKKKFFIFNQEGEFLKEIHLPSRMRAVIPLENGNYIALKQSMDLEGFEPSLQSFLCLYDSELKEIKELDRQRPSDYMTADKMDGIPQMFHWEVSNGKIYTGNGKRGYEILVYDLQGTLVKKIRKNYKSVKVPEEYKQSILSKYPENDPWRKKIFFSGDMPPYIEFFIDEVGRIFVMTYEKDESSGDYMYDIFNREGIFIGRKGLNILLKGEGWGVFNYIVAKQNRLYHLRTKENGYKELVVYRIKWE
jgi:hypothetical protein